MNTNTIINKLLYALMLKEDILAIDIEQIYSPDKKRYFKRYTLREVIEGKKQYKDYILRTYKPVEVIQFLAARLNNENTN